MSLTAAGRLFHARDAATGNERSPRCIPVLLYGLKACPLLKSDLSSVDFVIVRFLVKLFNTTNTDIINNCRQYFDAKLPSTLWSDCVRRSEKKFAECDNIFCKISVSIR